MLGNYYVENSEWPDSTLELRRFIELNPILSYPEYNWDALEIEKLDDGRVKVLYEDANFKFTTTLDKFKVTKIN